jgi:hypothetical protein
MNNEQTLKQQRTRMKNRPCYGEVTNGRGNVKEGSKSDEYV